MNRRIAIRIFFAVFCVFNFIPILSFADENVFPISGNVGIGTVTPSEKLEIAGGGTILTSKSLDNTDFDGLVIGRAGSWYNYQGDYSNIVFTNSNSNSNVMGMIGMTYSNPYGRMDFHSFYDSTKGGFGASGPLMSILGNGNVGIGTDNPSEKLHVLGSIYFRDDEASIPNDLESKVAHKIRTYLNDELTYGYVKGLEVITELSSGRQVGDPSNTRYIQGLVGIQTVRGGELYGNSYGVFGLSYVRDGGIIHGDSISVYGQGVTNSTGHVTGDLIGVYGNVATVGQVDGKRWAGYFNGNTYIDGNLGIGRTDPQAKLDVNGTIKAKEIKVTVASVNEVNVTDAQWSDFVFEDSYKLPSLDHVESYIKENKHLPDVPSAKQIAEDGLSMAEMMARQMQKIEELTLYVIELKKQNETLAEISSELKKENRELKERVAVIEGMR